MNSIEYWELKNMSVKFDVGDERSAFVQAGYQIAGIMVTLAISIFGGIVTGKNFLVISVLSKNRNEAIRWVTEKLYQHASTSLSYSESCH